MQLELNYYYSLTPRVFVNTLIGYRKKEDEKLKTSWEQTRINAYHSVMWNKKPPELLEFMKFTWEQNPQPKLPKPTKKAVYNTFKKWDKIKFKKQE
ncbi:hypothetical protein ACFQZW_12890 [Lutibacter aestuarii]|uniref:Uncharacterized protein n=1 Tax=Lutibacter aestuarii TaxID=861111 RepID=A0ABW2Z8C1_9FLAO